MPLRIGSVPYLNAKPLVDWFHSGECDADVEVVYAVPSRLAEMLRRRELKAKKRVATKVPRSAKEKRLTAKKVVSQRKKLRSTLD